MSLNQLLLFQLPVLRQGYLMYITGIAQASQVLSALETRADFRHFLLGDCSKGGQLSLCDFINRPLSHIQEVHGVLNVICNTTEYGTANRKAFEKILNGKLGKKCVLLITLKNKMNMEIHFIGFCTATKQVTLAMFLLHTVLSYNLCP